ncbi:AMP-binding protein [Streptomyces sp. BR123]|uniref:AMP-binding protein n=1 Tax=Streptomyces sp. BR123 TaxID=2749828 RepID=UPI0015C42346|nr:AMP-binding protein [Streptomyces sp. BR123]NXY98454.1 AMP-binding protein [Streptomyces sp. BR123]
MTSATTRQAVSQRGPAAAAAGPGIGPDTGPGVGVGPGPGRGSGDLDAQSLAGLLERNARAHPDKPAVIHPDRPRGIRGALPAGPDRGPAEVPAYGTLTYGRLQEAVEQLAAGFTRAGITKGTKTVLMAPPGPELFALVFALFRIGAVPVVVDPGMGVRRMLHCYRTVGAEAFIGPPLAHLVRLLGRRTFAGIRVPVTLGRHRLGRARTLTAVRALGADSTRRGGTAPVAAGRDDLLMIGFTTGSTGPAKGVEYTHRMALSIARQIEAVHGRTSEDTSLVTLPFYGVLDLVYGSTLVLAPLAPARVAQADPALLVDALERFGVTTMFASPALLRTLADHLTAATPGRHELPALRCIVGGGAPVPDTTVAALRRVLHADARIHVTYGATEVLPITSIEAGELLGDPVADAASAAVADPTAPAEPAEPAAPAGGGTAARAAEGAGTCVGRPVPGTRVAILPVTDGPLPRLGTGARLPVGRVGEIAVHGASVSPRYHRSPEADRLHKVLDATADDAADAAADDAADAAGTGAAAVTAGSTPQRTWHRTGDLGYLDEQGRLWFCGRAAQRVRAEHRDLHTVRCEGVFNAHPLVRRTALVGVTDTTSPHGTGPAAGPASGTTADSGWGRGRGGAGGAGGAGQGPRRPQRPVVCVETEGDLDAEAWPRLVAELRALACAHPPTTGLEQAEFLRHPGFPVDIRHNAKIGREELARWAERRLAPPAPLLSRDRAEQLVPLAGWAYLVGGAVWAATAGVPAARLPRVLWWTDAVLSIAGHAAQIPLALPRARAAGIGRPAAAGLTLLYGATWWRKL